MGLYRDDGYDYGSMQEQPGDGIVVSSMVASSPNKIRSRSLLVRPVHLLDILDMLVEVRNMGAVQ